MSAKNRRRKKYATSYRAYLNHGKSTSMEAISGNVSDHIKWYTDRKSFTTKPNGGKSKAK